MVPIGWSDFLSASHASAIEFSCSDQSLPTDDTNLVVRAAKLLARRAGAQIGVALQLDKNIPSGAGLGGGSSDAATTLLLLSDVWNLDVPADELSRMAAELGSDVPFFLQPNAAVTSGRGEVISPITTTDGAPYRLPFDVVVAVPPVFISTSEAYQLVEPNGQDRPDLVSIVLRNDLEEWRAHLVNDFERVILDRLPVVVRAKQLLLESGAGYAALSGSGAAVFGVFESSIDAREAAAALEQVGCRVWIDLAATSRQQPIQAYQPMRPASALPVSPPPSVDSR